MNNSFLGIIPARYASSRLPGKPLLMIGDKPVIQHVYDRVSQVMGDRVLVATDDDRIRDCVESFGGRAVMTSPDQPSGTDRVREAYNLSGMETDVILNVQGDEPFVSPLQIESLMQVFEDTRVDIATTIIPLNEKNATLQDLNNPNNVKVVKDTSGRVIYFSRSPVPYVRGVEGDELLRIGAYFKHLGMYAYRTHVLESITELPVSPLEKLEKLEQLRWLEAGYMIQSVVSQEMTIGIDTEADLEEARRYFELRSHR